MQSVTNELPFINLAGEYLAGILRGEDLQRFKKLLVNDPKAKTAVDKLETLMDAFLGVNAIEALRAARNEGRSADNTHETWPVIAPGVMGRVLHYDHLVGSMVYIARMEPDSQCHAADDGSPEECLLISGDFSLSNVTLRAGDRYSASKSVIHSGGHTDNGAVLLIRAQDA